MPYRLTERQAMYLQLTVERGLGPKAVARECGKTERHAGGGVALALLDICNNFAVATPEEAYAIALAEGLIVPLNPAG